MITRPPVAVADLVTFYDLGRPAIGLNGRVLRKHNPTFVLTNEGTAKRNRKGCPRADPVHKLGTDCYDAKSALVGLIVLEWRQDG